MSLNDTYRVEVVGSLDVINETEWQSLAEENPFVGYRFLRLLQDTGCVSKDQGWLPQILLVYRNDSLVGAAPCYLKWHSRGEFVFDQGWAEAYERHGLHYYPKLVVTAPFSPVQGPRLLATDLEARMVLAEALVELCHALSASSVHVLFVQDADKAALSNAGYMVRESVQFHWQNQGYESLEEFLQQLTSEKRKKIRQDSRYVAEAGVFYETLEGDSLRDEHIEFFFQCYEKTYQEHWSQPYLSKNFFERAHYERALDFVMIIAKRGDRPIACALNVKGESTLYGRYWGCLEFVKGLHFETCYTRAIAYCIEQGFSVFEGGAQGEHKMSRGLKPVKTYSAHFIENRSFASAIEDFLGRETVSIDGYYSALELSSPFKNS